MSADVDKRDATLGYQTPHKADRGSKPSGGLVGREQTVGHVCPFG
jgi:hypothetical protein